MEPVKTVGVIGLGALGVLYSHLFTEALGKEHVLILADSSRIHRYRQDGIWFNGTRCDFNYVDAASVTAPLDLLLFAVKFGGLADAISTCRHLVGPDTILLSVLNGITSEEILGTVFCPENVVWCTAQRMSARKDGNHVICNPIGDLSVGVPAGQDNHQFRRLTAFFDSIHFPYNTPEDIRVHLWSKLLCNVGCNQAAMVFQCGYGGLHKPGPARDAMLGAMREVVLVANAEGIPLSEADVASWTAILDSFPDDGEPSMRQDGKAHRKSEVELFSGTIRHLAAKHGIPVPVNDWLYHQVQEMERQY
jgi:2-dehydropantoate 2-reductase